MRKIQTFVAHRLACWTFLLLAGGLSLSGCSFGKTDAATRGQEVFETCVPCHNSDGSGNPTVGAPNIAGMKEWYVERELDKFRAGVRGMHFNNVEGMRMRPMALSLTCTIAFALWSSEPLRPLRCSSGPLGPLRKKRKRRNPRKILTALALERATDNRTRKRRRLQIEGNDPGEIAAQIVTTARRARWLTRWLGGNKNGFRRDPLVAKPIDSSGCIAQKRKGSGSIRARVHVPTDLPPSVGRPFSRRYTLFLKSSSEKPAGVRPSQRVK